MRYKIFAEYGAEAFSTERKGFFDDQQEGISEGEYGRLNLCHYVGDQPEHVATNRDLICRHLNITRNRLIMPRQTHTNNIEIIDDKFLNLSNEEKEEKLMDIDALVTCEKNICIGINTADCVPIVIYSHDKKVAAAIHAGWRGIVSHIARNAINIMKEKFGCDIENMLCAVGPHISAESYEVGEDLKEKFGNAGYNTKEIFIYSTKWRKAHLDMRKAVEKELTNCGIKRGNIEFANICTYCHSDQYFSARRSGIESGRIFTGIIIK